VSLTNAKASIGSGAADWEVFAGEWVVIQDETVIEHGRDLAEIAERARSRGIRRPRVVFVEPRRERAVKLGL
jgi:hypothetical protein